MERDGDTNQIVKFGAVACITGGVTANFSSSAPKIMYYSARGPDPEDSFLDDADILKPNLVAPGNFIWAAWSSGGTDSVEFLGKLETSTKTLFTSPRYPSPRKSHVLTCFQKRPTLFLSNMTYLAM